MMTSIIHLLFAANPRRTKLMRATDAFPSRVTPQADPDGRHFEGKPTRRRQPQGESARRAPQSLRLTRDQRPRPTPVNISREVRIGLAALWTSEAQAWGVLGVADSALRLPGRHGRTSLSCSAASVAPVA